MRSSGGSQGFQMATLPLKYCPRLISICYVRLVGKHIFFDWCIPQAAFSDSAVSWLLFFAVFCFPSSSSSPIWTVCQWNPRKTCAKSRLMLASGAVSPLGPAARRLALLVGEASASPPRGECKSLTFGRLFFFLPVTKTFDWSSSSSPRSPTCAH